MAIILISFAYSRFATQQILQESIEHLEEIYNQINDNFRSPVSKNWRLLLEELYRQFSGGKSRWIYCLY